MQTLLTDDGRLVSISNQASKMSLVLRDMLSNCSSDDEPFPVLNLDGETAQQVVKFCQFYTDHSGEHQRKAFNREFFRGMDRSKLAKLTVAANFLDIDLLMDLTAKELVQSINTNQSSK